jgi:crossover junction endodeoxyribonuclease RuvC
MSLIIGIDPGSRLTGYGIIQKEGQKLIFVDAGTIRTEAADMPERLKRIFAGIDRIVKFHGPTEAAVEQVFMAQNPDSALKLGQARGAAIAALVNLDLQVAEYTARQIKQSVVGYGAADKEQVQMMVIYTQLAPAGGQKNFKQIVQQAFSRYKVIEKKLYHYDL